MNLGFVLKLAKLRGQLRKGTHEEREHAATIRWLQKYGNVVESP